MSAGAFSQAPSHERAESSPGSADALGRVAAPGRPQLPLSFATRVRAALGRSWPLLGIVGLAAVLRLATLGEQSLWFDEAFTPVHVFHPSLFATLRAIAHTENTPPLWYVLDWGVWRVLGGGAVALRLLSALAGIATVPVAWAIARRLAGERAALLACALVAVSPLFVWYSQEARAYALFVLITALSILCFLRALESPTRGRVGVFALCGSLALLTHYFAVFLLAPMVVWLAAVLLGWGARAAPAGIVETPGGTLAPPDVHPHRGEAGGANIAHTGVPRARVRVRARARAAGAFALLCIPILVGAALIPLVLAQTSHHTAQWIGSWSLPSRLQAIPQYYLTGYSGAPLGHTVELLVALPALVGIAISLLAGRLNGRERQAAWIALLIAGCGALIPLALALGGADYLAPRNLVGATIPLTVLLAVLLAPQRSGLLGGLLAGAFALALLAVTLDVDRSARLQRGDWSGVAAVLRRADPAHVVTTVHLGTAPLRYYLPSLRPPSPHPLSGTGGSVTVREIDETGYPPLRPGAGRPPAGGFRLVERRDVRGLLVYRFVSRAPVTISAQALRQDGIAAARTEVLIPAKR